MVRSGYDQNVFVNCPFDSKYRPLFEAIVFAVQALGFRVRCARERLDSADVRFTKIVELIGSCRYSIHDLSRTELDRVTGLPRFNMPLELGVDLGCRLFSGKHRNKAVLILDTERYRYQQYISDIAGQDVSPHGDDPYMAILQLRNWLRTASGVLLWGGEQTYMRYLKFCKNLPRVCNRLRLDAGELSFADFSFTIAMWLKEQH
jgi:hypothetical protein